MINFVEEFSSNIQKCIKQKEIDDAPISKNDIFLDKS